MAADLHVKAQQSNRPSPSPFEGLFVVAKFFNSKAPNGDFNCISRTLGKLSIIAKAFNGKVQDREVWISQIVCEIKPGQNQGNFVLMPHQKIEDIGKLRKLIPGFYDLEPLGKSAILRPKSDPQDLWVLSKATRQLYNRKYNAVVVPIQFLSI